MWNIRKKDLETELSGDIWSEDSVRARALQREYGDVSKKIELSVETKKLLESTLETFQLAVEDEEIARQWESDARRAVEKLEFWDRQLLLNGKYDHAEAIIAIHAGAGGTEAQDWASMLYRMMLRFCEQNGWDVSVIGESAGSEAGIKSVMFEVTASDAYGWLRHEAGVHRLVRISPFDADKARHTSFALVEVTPVLEELDEVDINPDELRVDTFMSGGHGGQSVNTTYSAVRIVHVPTGIAVQCQNERSQSQNKETAMRVLKSKLHQKHLAEVAAEKKELRGEFKSAEWGNQIRSYVLHPYRMVKDHRTNHETSDPEKILNGNLWEWIEAHARLEATTSVENENR